MKRMLPVTLVALGIVTASGCASQQTTSAQPAHTSAGQFSPELNALLSSATSSGAVTVAHSPWGSNVAVLANPSYFAASGRTCRELEVTLPSGTTEHHIACKTGDNSWASVRPVTRLLNP
ncbi:DVU3141 family protein [Zobellella denitrificans]